MSFDIVIPVGPHDMNRIQEQIKHTKKNVIDYRNIYIISSDPSLKVDNCIVIDENIYPFSKKDVEKYHGKGDRTGWYLQQLLKLYVYQVIPDLLERYLILDSDTFFLKPMTFIDATDGKCLYNFSNENHIPYYDHMKRLSDTFIKINTNSGICHHMMFEKKYIQEIIDITENNHKKPFWVSFLELVEEDCRHNGRSGASEYEIYFNYVFKYHADKVKIRELKWVNLYKWMKIIPEYDYVSIHWYLL